MVGRSRLESIITLIAEVYVLSVFVWLVYEVYTRFGNSRVCSFWILIVLWMVLNFKGFSLVVMFLLSGRSP